MADEAPPVATDAVSSNQTPAANSSGSKLKELIDAANLQYSLKNYANAADLYSSATELQAELNGEMAPENADLLYLYGRCLFKVAVAKSGVLGGQVAGEKKKSTANGASKQKGDSAGDTLASNDAKLAEGIVVAALEQKDAPKSAGHEETTPANQPYFQITGMENWDSEEEDGEDGGEAEEEEDDFANAFEILDLARVLLQREIEAVVSERTNTSGKGKAAESDKSALSSLRERLADTQDLQAEIALENERFSDAATDFKASLALKQELHPKESEIIAEAHYKLSLALEFASMNKVREAQAEEGQQMMMVKKDDIDEELRREAAKEMELAIESCRLRIAKEEALLDTLDSDAAKEKAKSIAEVKEIVTDMEQKLGDLRDLNSLSRFDLPSGGVPVANPVGGILSEALGETPAEQKTRIDEAAKKARDLTGLVRHRKKPKTEEAQAGAVDDGTAQTNGKRKLDDTEDAEEEAKKIKIDG